MKTFHIDYRTDIVTSLPSFQFTRDTASFSESGSSIEQSFIRVETNSNQFSGKEGTMRLQFDLFSYNYFKFNVETFGHIIALARYDNLTTLVNKIVTGQGVVIGNASNLPNGNNKIPSVQAITGSSDSGFNLSNATAMPATLKDQTQYRFVVDSIITADWINKCRYRCYEVTGVDKLSLLFDTGQVTVGPVTFSNTASGVFIGHVMGNKTADLWRLEFTNVKVIWGAYLNGDTIPFDSCSCPRNVTIRSTNTGLFELDNSDFKIGLDYGQLTISPNGTPIFGFKDFATKTEKGYRIQHLNTSFCRVPAFLNLGVKFKSPEKVLSRNLRTNILTPKGYDSWAVEVTGSVTVLHDVIEFAQGGNTSSFNWILSEGVLDLGKTTIPKIVLDSSRLDTATFMQFKLTSEQLAGQRTRRKNVFFIFKFDKIAYCLNTGIVGQEKHVVSPGDEVVVNIPIDLGQSDCCGDDIDNLPEVLPPAIMPIVANSRLTIYLNNSMIPVTPISYTGGTNPVTMSIAPELPDGVKFNKNTGELYGTPAKVFPQTDFVITFKDAKNEEASASFNLRVDSGDPI